MKIGLLDPGSKRLFFNESFPHLGLAYIAAVLEERGHDVRFLDVSLAEEKELRRFLDDDYGWIGFSVTSFTLNQALEMAKQAKALHRDAVIVFGGPHVSIGTESTLESSCVDYAVHGEGELTILELTEALQESREPTSQVLSSIHGLVYREEGRIVSNPRRERLDDLDKLPYPAYHLFRMDEYQAYPLLTSRGCPYGCTYCAIKAIWGTLWKYRSPENVVQEMEDSLERYKREKMHFGIMDDSFNVNPERVMEFCDLILERGLNIMWSSAGFRADNVTLPLALKMKKAGCFSVSVGIESASNEILKRIKKHETIEEITLGCQNLARAGIPVHAQFMIGNPGDTLESAKESMKFAKRHPFASVTFYLALPYPKTELWDYVKAKGRFLKEDYTLFHHFCGEPVFETPEFSARERAKTYAMGRRLSIRVKIREEVRDKLARIRRLDFQGVNPRRVFHVVNRLTKHLLDLSLGRDEKV